MSSKHLLWNLDKVLAVAESTKLDYVQRAKLLGFKVSSKPELEERLSAGFMKCKELIDKDALFLFADEDIRREAIAAVTDDGLFYIIHDTLIPYTAKGEVIMLTDFKNPNNSKNPLFKSVLRDIMQCEGNSLDYIMSRLEARKDIEIVDAFDPEVFDEDSINNFHTTYEIEADVAKLIYKPGDEFPIFMITDRGIYMILYSKCAPFGEAEFIFKINNE